MIEHGCSLECQGTNVMVHPNRGALVSHLTVGGVDLLYLEEATIDSPTGAVRGGVPILFPFAGELADGRLAASGTEMPRHGFARRKAWEVIDRSADAIAMRLAPDDDTRRQYPFDFVVSQTVTATPRGLRIDLHVDSRDRRPLPVAPGWHPYFPCPEALKRNCLRQVIADADFTSLEPAACDVNVRASPSRTVEFSLPNRGRLSITFSPNVETLEVWTPPAADFICIEPWVGPTNAVNTPARVEVPPGGRAAFWMAIERLADSV